MISRPPYNKEEKIYRSSICFFLDLTKLVKIHTSSLYFWTFFPSQFKKIYLQTYQFFANSAKKYYQNIAPTMKGTQITKQKKVTHDHP